MKTDKCRPPETEYEDFVNVTSVLKAVAEALLENQISRFVSVIGENGCGKDAAINALTRRWPRLVTITEAHGFWRDDCKNPSVNTMLADLLRALNPARRNGSSIPQGSADRLQLIIDDLSARKLVLIINEADCLGPNGLGIIKTLINRTPVIIVAFFKPVLLSRLIKKSFEEAKQLFGNRLSSQVILRGPAKDEIASFLERRCLTFDRPETANLAAAIIETESVRLGNWRFVTRIARQCWDRFGSNPITLDKFGQALAAAKDTCVLSYQGPRQ